MRSFLAIFCATILAAPVAAQHEHAAAYTQSDPQLNAQIEAVRHATERYRDHRNAAADGYKKFGEDGPLMGEHWFHPDLVKKPLDLERPATLQYANINGKQVLVGVAYNVYQRPGQSIPEGFAGAQDHWHVHDVPKLARTLVEDRPFLRWVVNRRIERGKVGAGDNRTQLVMLHAWIWQENFQGMFAQEHRALPYLRAGLSADWAKAASADAAFGVSLLRGGCEREIERIDKLAKLSRPQRRELSAACEQAASEVGNVAASAGSAETLNQAAQRSWQRYVATREGTLTAAQKRRLSSVMEPMMGH